MNYLLGDFESKQKYFEGFNVSSNADFKKVFSSISPAYHISKSSAQVLSKQNISLCAEIPARKQPKCSKHFSACFPDKEMIKCIQSFNIQTAFLVIESPQDKQKVVHYFERKSLGIQYILLNESDIDPNLQFPGMNSMIEQEICSKTDIFIGNPWSSWSATVFNRRTLENRISTKWWECSSRKQDVPHF